MKWSINRLLRQLSDDENITFHFAKGYLDSPPPPWLAEQLEGPPHLRFFQWDSAFLDIGYDRHVEKHGVPDLKNIRDTDVEEAKRDLAPIYEDLDIAPEPWSVSVALEYLHNIIEDEGPFHGVIGVSEGAAVAATLLVEDLQSRAAGGTRSDLRCGLFYIGAPAMSADGTRAVLYEEDGQVVNVPTCHVMGVKDMFRVFAEPLLKICDPDKALVINDPGGHRIPQDVETNDLIAEWIRQQQREFVKEQRDGAAALGSA